MENKRNTILIIATMVVTVVVLVLVVITMTLGNPGAPARTGGSDTVLEDTIAVYGQGKISLQPDVAYITLGVETMNLDPQKAQDDNAQSMNQVKAALKSAGLDDADIQTTNYNVYQRFEYIGDRRNLIGYEVTNTVQVTINDVDGAGDIIKIASDAGANRFHGIRFDVIERQAAYIDALDLALERAEEKAQKLAQETGREVVGVVTVQEGSAASSPFSPSLANFAMEAAPMADSSGGGAISSGELEITAVVNVIYRLK